MSEVVALQKEVSHLKNKFQELTSIMIALNKEKNLDKLLAKIVYFARKFTNADAGTLYVCNKNQLEFSIVQNDTLKLDTNRPSKKFQWESIAIEEKNSGNVAINCALNKETINIDDVYTQTLYSVEGTKAFDTKTGYTSRSMLVVPIIEGDDEEVVGVLQLLNKIDKDDAKVTFTEDDSELIHSLAALCASALVRLKGETKKLRRINKWLERQKDQLEYLANTDQLTKASNRLKFNKELSKAYAITQERGGAFGFIIFDIDHFKKINDTYGHDVGDYVLQTLSQLIIKKLPKEHLFARWGGEEFVILVNSHDLQRATIIAEDIRMIIESYDFDHVKQITCSFGVSLLKKNENTQTLITRADEALYEAKRGGRNQVKSA
jgi:diguanylate cyclase (GGDEF)-like protein